MPRSNNAAMVMQDDAGLFIRVGTSKYRPTQPMKGVRKGSMVKAWPWNTGIKVEAGQGPADVWPRAE